MTPNAPAGFAPERRTGPGGDGDSSRRGRPWARTGAAAVAVAFLAVLAAPRAARAQPVKPNVLIIFDTSGSMEESSPGMSSGADGTNICGFSGSNSRLALLKKGIRDALAQVGTDEVNFGLMSFPTLVDPSVNPVCYSCCNIALNGNTFAGHFYISNPDGDRGCAMTTHSQAGFPTTYGASWFDPGIPQALRVDVTKVTPGTHPAAGDFDPTDANIARVYKWIDNTEDAGPVSGALTDPELHAMGATPLGLSMFYARMYFENFIKPADARSCRQNLVILVTDGFETCSNNATVDAATCAFSGDELNAAVQACRLNRNDGINTYVLTDAAVTGGANDSIAAVGGTGASIKITLADSAAVRAKLVEIIAKAVPPVEVCNGVDDNCNGLVDEGVSNKCPWDPAAPTSDGGKHCAVESCNCLDDNCDGRTDEGLPPNKCGGPCGCAVPTEICNGLDEDCDGVPDNGFDVGTPCDNGLKGACKRVGIKECTADGKGTACSAPSAAGTPELCNGVDDNCNGMTDEGGPLPGEGEVCGVDIGVCKSGKTICKDGKIVCNTTKAGSPEVCNGIDDDCNGVTDDGVFPEEGKDCLCPGLDASKAGVGECKKGKLVCKGAMGFVCEGCVLPTPELCDGKDNDCDGMTDFKAPCPGGFACKDGQCALACGTGEFKCPPCYKCNPENYCIKQLCCGVTCTSGWLCDEKDGKCKDQCAGVSCTAPKVCQAGVCVDCYTTGCATPGQKCLGGLCKTDPCADVRCGANEYCDDGTCIPTCAGKSCAAGQRCVAGNCRSDLCGDVACPQHQFCDPQTGACKDDPCTTMQCSPGQRCIPARGRCETDPCESISCQHPCLVCEITGDGVGQCVTDLACKSTRTTIGGQGGGGCGCRLARGDDHGAGGAALLVALICLRGFRRRKMTL